MSSPRMPRRDDAARHDGAARHDDATAGPATTREDNREDNTATAAPPRRRWRIVDIVTAAVLGAATGVIFIMWNVPGAAFGDAFDALTPGFSGLMLGPWLIGGTLGGLIIRKPGAALFTEVLAATVSMAVGNEWGASTVYLGIAQGLGAELVFLLLAYRRFGAVAAALSGMGAAAANWILSLVMFGYAAKTATFNIIYVVCSQLSGILLCGLLAWALVRALARTGALDRFAAGREGRALV